MCFTDRFIKTRKHPPLPLNLWKYASANYLIQMFLIEKIDREPACDRRIWTIGPGNVIVQSNTYEASGFGGDGGDLSQNGAIISFNPCWTGCVCIDQDHRGQVPGDRFCILQDFTYRRTSAAR